uniref:Lipoyltransferase 1, mitochondrial n=1 Tax=Caligus clemensi TaxID=344056 RepID=C1C1J8_CALCM|nr:Lipoyltransferase 1, mitochondrial precursor [Caligus clemensi]
MMSIARRTTGLPLHGVKRTSFNLLKRSWSWKGNGNEEEGGLKMNDPLREVFISQSNDIFSNLALEDWLYRHHDFQHKHLLLLWRNNPCVVIGRHQNPWVEANVPFLRGQDIDLARRNSGGGTVYHDLGNINCTFFTHRDQYRRRHNLEIICSAIQRLTNLNVGINAREDIVLNSETKISGTAAKLGRCSAYHHCTVLVDVNGAVLHESLNSKASNIESRATQSVRVPVQNIKEAYPSATTDSLLESIGWEFLRTDVNGDDQGLSNNKNRGFHLVRPDNDWYKGLDDIKKELQGYNWVFGKTPKFRVVRTFQLPENLMPEISGTSPSIGFELVVEKGFVIDVKIALPRGMLDPDYDLANILYGQPFTKNLPQLVEASLDSVFDEKKNFLMECVQESIRGIV